MFLLKPLLALATATLFARAQTPALTFNSVPNPMSVGVAQTITYGAPDLASPVTIVLRRGAATDLATLATLTTTATGGTFVWTPPPTLVSDTDYALEIRQDGVNNFFGPFELLGGADEVVDEVVDESEEMPVMGPSASTEVMPEETFAVATAAVTTTMARTGYYATGTISTTMMPSASASASAGMGNATDSVVMALPSMPVSNAGVGAVGGFAAVGSVACALAAVALGW